MRRILVDCCLVGNETGRHPRKKSTYKYPHPMLPPRLRGQIPYTPGFLAFPRLIFRVECWFVGDEIGPQSCKKSNIKLGPLLCPMLLLFRDRHARRYLQEARESAAELGGALHDPSAVARCLAAAETLLSGNTAGHWAMPASLPSASTYQVCTEN